VALGGLSFTVAPGPVTGFAGRQVHDGSACASDSGSPPRCSETGGLLEPIAPSDRIEIADDLGYYACYSADEIYHNDAWLLFAAAADRTERLRLGPCVAAIFMRDPSHVAQSAATLDELSGGRAEVVLGIGNIAMLEQYGIDWRGARAIGRLREAHRVVRTLLDEGSIDFQGDFFRYQGVATAARPVQQRVPVKIGAMGGPKSMELAGEVADGLHAACAYSTEALRYAVDRFRAGAERAGHQSRGSILATRCWEPSRPTGASLGGRVASWPPSTSRPCRLHS
jgi:alkanesulfonate monooxygenase SsuD/methylene tetrahydromethanopterin reductase-like flavin-dependent oxidoreductase (luciferase family)